MHTGTAGSDGAKDFILYSNTYSLFPFSLGIRILLGLTVVLSVLYHTYPDIKTPELSPHGDLYIGMMMTDCNGHPSEPL